MCACKYTYKSTYVSTCVDILDARIHLQTEEDCFYWILKLHGVLQLPLGEGLEDTWRCQGGGGFFLWPSGMAKDHHSLASKRASLLNKKPVGFIFNLGSLV